MAFCVAIKAAPGLCCGLFLLFSGSSALSAPACTAGQVPIHAVLARWDEPGLYILADGKQVKAEGVRITADAANQIPTPGTRLTIFSQGQDRYGRLRGQILLPNGEWLQQRLLRQGFARVETAPDGSRCAGEFYAAEQSARSARVGLWSAAGSSVRNTFLPKSDTGTFQIVEGKVLAVEIRNGRAYLNFGADYRTDFTVTISPEDRKLYWPNDSPRTYLNRTIRVRGIVQYFNGPQIEIAAPHQIEVVQ